MPGAKTSVIEGWILGLKHGGVIGVGSRVCVLLIVVDNTLNVLVANVCELSRDVEQHGKWLHLLVIFYGEHS